MQDDVLVDADEPLDDVRTEWMRLHLWLVASFPEAAARIRPPSGRPVPAELVEGSGGAWPDDLVGWFGLHDGAEHGTFSDFLGGYRILGAQEALESWQGDLAAAEIFDADERAGSEGDAGEDTMIYDPRFVPIAADGATGTLVVDLRPGPARGSVVAFGPESGTDYHADSDPSLAALVRRVLLTLQDPAAAGYVESGDAMAFIATMTSYDPDAEEWMAADEAAWREADLQPGAFSPPLRRASPEPAWSWARVGDAVSDTNWGDDAQALAILGPAFDYLLTLDVDELGAATAEEPTEVPHVGLEAFIGAAVDHAYAVRGLEPPAWTRGRTRRITGGAWSVLDVPSAELRRLRATPDAFSAHGIRFTWSS
ncbi:MAG: hypothetical protein U0R68_00455 [Candidatus Nanopelagicales bacterium]